MHLVPLALLVLSLTVLAWTTRRNAREYVRFKALTETADRQRFYRRVLTGSFLLFGVGSLALLALLGDLDSLAHPPRAFFALRTVMARALGDAGPAFLGGLAGGVTAGVALAVAIALARRSRRADGASKPPRALGDVVPLLPRNGAETRWTAALSINAGISEELFFRLTLPLLFTLVVGDAIVGFALACAVFGLAHLYQGIAGVVATGILGVVFAFLYLATGSLILPIVLHVLIDLMGLVVRPTLLRRRAARASQA